MMSADSSRPEASTQLQKKAAATGRFEWPVAAGNWRYSPPVTARHGLWISCGAAVGPRTANS